MNAETRFFPIAAVERDTGLGKDTLRVWERRYGFPTPIRDLNGVRCYSGEQVSKLRRIKRLMDAGLRPGKIFGMSEEEWEAWLPQRIAAANLDAVAATGLLEMVRMQRSEELRHALQQSLLKQGLERFITETVAPLTVEVGEAWSKGQISVPDEHLYTEHVQNILRSAIALRTSSSQSPRILLTTFPDEQHSLGLLMAEALLVSEGAQCVSLGTQTPLTDIVRALSDGGFDVLALSFASTFPLRHAVAGLRTLSAQLPETEIWAGGRGIAHRIPSIPRVHIMDDLATALRALHDWRAARPA